MLDQQEICEKILFNTFGSHAELKSTSQIAAGNHNQGIRIESTEGAFFLKLNFDHEHEILEKEAKGLKLLQQSTFLKVPNVFSSGRVANYNYLLSEFIKPSKQEPDYWDSLGLGLAHLHLTTQETFGLNEDNFIASLHQKNVNTANWTDFFIEQRLEPFLGKAYFDQLISLGFLKKFQKIYPHLHSLFPKEKPALVHGDLWSGNVIISNEGQPCLIDPAIYFGHREMDIAFSRLFGGFSQRFYDSYQEGLPMELGFEERMGVYNLYPLLVHLILFGSSYLPGIERIVNRFK